jgi:hypothetical protein
MTPTFSSSLLSITSLTWSELHFHNRLLWDKHLHGGNIKSTLFRQLLSTLPPTRLHTTLDHSMPT